MSEFAVDPELRAEYIDESLDGLAQVANLFVQLEADPSHLETVEAIFRPVHSIKGNAAYFDLLKVKELSHVMETLLDLVRKKSLRANSHIVDTLLKGVDELTAMLRRARADEPEVVDPDAFKALVDRVGAATRGEEALDPAPLFRELLGALETLRVEAPQAAESAEAAARCAERLAAMLVDGFGEPETLGEDAVEAFVLPEPAAALKQLLDQEIKSHLDETAAAEVGELLRRTRECAREGDARAQIDDALSNYEMLVETVGVDPILQSIVLEKIDAVTATGGWLGAEKEAAPPVEAVRADAPSAADDDAAATKKTDSGKTMRVTEQSIDAFLAFVGDLVVVREMYQHIQGRLAESQRPENQNHARDMQRVNESFDNLSNDLQKSIMDIRKAPLNTVFQRVPRIIRDVAAERGKQIETRIEGESIRVDKSILDAVEAPLTHMTRNSADHGIEPAGVRIANGKNPTGLVTVSARETADTVFITVEDDGAGINVDKLREKGAALGLVAPDARLSPEEIVQLVFSSGVSTAEQVTDVSGRGVGMDVAKRNVESLGGRILVENRPGRGCTFTIQAPRTVSTQIITGFSVLVGGRRFILPMDRVVRCFRPRAGEIVTVKGEGECVKHNGAVVPICRFRAVDGVRARDVAELYEGILILVERGRTVYALHVDDIEGVKQVVLKEIAGFLNRDGIFAGGAVMGDSTVAMIVDIDAFVEKALEGQRGLVRTAAETPEEKSPDRAAQP